MFTKFSFVVFFLKTNVKCQKKEKEESIFLVHIFNLPSPSPSPSPSLSLLPDPPPSPSSPSLSLLPAPPPPPPPLLPIHLNQNTKQITLFSKVLGLLERKFGYHPRR